MTDEKLPKVPLAFPGVVIEKNVPEAEGFVVAMGLPDDRDSDDLHIPDLDDLPDDDLPPAAHDPKKPGAAHTPERLDGPAGEPDDLHAGDWDDELPSANPGRSGFDASVANDLVLDPFLGFDDERGLQHGDQRGFDQHDAGDTDDVSHFEGVIYDGAEVPLVIGDFEIDDDPRPRTDDGGVEGTSEDIAAEVNEADLPELDQDDGGAFELDDLMRELRAGGLGHESEGDGWVVYEGWGARVPCFAIATDSGRILAGGDQLLFIEAGAEVARAAALPRRATAIAASPDGAVVGTARGVLLATALGKSVTTGAPAPTMALLDTDAPVRALAGFAGRTWALIGEELWQIGSPPAAPIRARSGILAMATARDSLVVLSASGALERYRGDDGDWEPIVLPSDARAMLALSDPKTISVCARGQTLALSSPSGIFVSREGGAKTAAIEIEHVVAIAFGGPVVDPTLVVATSVADALVIVSVDQRNRTRIEGRLDVGSPADASASGVAPHLAMIWDETREALFLATPAGLFAAGPRRTH